MSDEIPSLNLFNDLQAKRQTLLEAQGHVIRPIMLGLYGEALKEYEVDHFEVHSDPMKVEGGWQEASFRIVWRRK